MSKLYLTAAQIESIRREARQARAAYLADLIQSFCHRLAERVHRLPQARRLQTR